jgi:glycosyltransferase involved in cell wall biosynthesis
MKWNILAPFFNSSNSTWIDDHLDDPSLDFEKIRIPSSYKSWHTQKSSVTGLKSWAEHWKHAQSGLAQPCDGIITLFPQLAVMTGLQMRLRRDKRPLIAWCFNLGACYPGIKQKLSKFSLDNVSKFIVHSSAETQYYSDWLQLPKNRFLFVPLQRGELPLEFAEEREEPFVLSIGSAKRDYATFFQAVGRLGYKTVVIASKWSVEGLSIPDNVTVLNNLSHAECRRYVQRARLNIVPIDNNQTASGQVTVIEAMRYGRPVIATDCIGTEDYIKDGVDGLLVKAKSVESLSGAIERLWNDEALRIQIGRSAQRTAEERFSDQAAAKSLRSILLEYQ